ncbi:MAG: VanZ family protein [Gemmatimonadaceae bacterium]
MRLLSLGAIIWVAGVVMWLTWAPFMAREQLGSVRWYLSTSLVDVAGNLLLMAPLAVLIIARQWRRETHPSLPRLTLAAALLSLTIETGQLYIDGRIPSPGDVVLNTAGAALAGWVTQALLRRGFRPALAIGLTTGGVFGVVLVHFAVSFAVAPFLLSLGNWDPLSPFLAGGARGTHPGDVRDAVLCVGEGGSRLCLTPGASRASRDSAVRIAERTQRFEIAATLLSGAEQQEEPSRIVGFSYPWRYGNVTLEQQGPHILLRARTSISGSTGSRFIFRLPDAVRPGVPTRVTAVFDRGSVTLTSRDGARTVEGRFPLTFVDAWLLQRTLGVVDPKHYARATIAGTLVLVTPLFLLAAEGARRRRSAL